MFHRPRDTETFKGPHVLIRAGCIGNGILASVFLQMTPCSRMVSSGIAGPLRGYGLSEGVCAYINSSLARYYQFLTASQWGVERDEVLLTEHKSLPCALPGLEHGSLSQNSRTR